MTSTFKPLESYTVLKGKDLKTFDIIKWHFERFLSAIKKRLTLKRKFHDPFLVNTTREINSFVFYEAYRAVRDYVISRGFTATCEKNKKGKVLSYNITFTHLGTFIFHLSQLSGLNKTEVSNSLKKVFPNDCKANVIVSNEKPAVLTFKVTTCVCLLRCHYETMNRFNNVTSY